MYVCTVLLVLPVMANKLHHICCEVSVIMIKQRSTLGQAVFRQTATAAAASAANRLRAKRCVMYFCAEGSAAVGSDG